MEIFIYKLTKMMYVCIYEYLYAYTCFSPFLYTFYFQLYCVLTCYRVYRRLAPSTFAFNLLLCYYCF